MNNEYSENDQVPVNETPTGLDGVIRKYISVWLFSILFGAYVSTSFSYATIRITDGRGGFAFIVIAAMLLGMIVLYRGFLLLIRYFRHSVIPLIHQVWANGSDTSLSESEDIVIERGEEISYLLSESIRQLVTALVLRILIQAFEVTFSAFAYF